MSFKIDDLPKVVQERIKIIETTVEDTNIEEIMRKYKEIYNLDFIAAAQTEELRHIYASQKLHSDFLARPKLSKHNIVPIGVDGVTRFGEGEPQQTFFAYHTGINKLISVRADKVSIPLVGQLTLGEYYENIKLVLTEARNYSIDDRAKLPSPTAYLGISDDHPESIDDLLMDVLKIRQIQMKDFENDKLISQRTAPRSDGRTFVLNTDWVCIRNCYVISTRKFPVKGMSGVFRGQLLVSDSSVAEDFTTSKGTIIPTRMNVWVAEKHFYPANSLLNLWGTVEHRKWQQEDPNDANKKIWRQNFQMNGYYAFPLGLGPDEEKS